MAARPRSGARLATAAAIAALIGAGAAGCGADDNGAAERRGKTVALVPSTTTTPATATTVPATTTAARPPAATTPSRPRTRPRTLRQRLATALRPLNARVDARITTPSELTVIARTPPADELQLETLDLRAGAIFQAVYGKAGHKRATVILFRGNLRDPRSGRTMRNTVAAIYTMQGLRARQIEFRSEDVVELTDWAPFRLTIHPILR